MSDPRIQLLGDHVCNKIAAGEVIERPASVFKELVENSLDAGADTLDIDVLQGGRKAVLVTDNGHGMSRENALLCIERHATSKIRDVDDIEHIHTMGFRGEALAAIAAVSRFRITTRRREDLAGTELLVESGTLKDVRDIGCPPGTTLEVRNLFLNVPARRKFLRTEATELANIRAMFTVFALAHPQVAFRLKVDGREIAHHPRHPSLAERIADIHGPGILDRLREVNFHNEALHIHGYAGLPDLHRSDRRDQVLLINRRAATAPILGYAIKEAYRDTLPRDRNPVLFLNLDMPPDWVDVNVHPTKREVRFRPTQHIRDALVQALSLALGRDTPPDLSEAPPVTEAHPPQLAPASRQQHLPVTGPAQYPPLPPLPPLPPRGMPAPPPEPPAQPPPAGTGVSGPWRHAEILGKTGGRFLLLETEDGLVILDPAAAQERILYERAMDELQNGKVSSQPLLLPESVTLNADAAETLRGRMEEARTLGFVLEPFGADTFLVEALPAWMGGLSAEAALEPLTREAETGALRPDTPRVLRDALAKSCCRRAADAARSMGETELRHLVNTLQNCRMPYTTPFGRPTIIHMGFRELHRKFGIG